MRALTIILVEPNPARLRGGLVLALSQSALGGSATLFLEGAAAALARMPITAPEDGAWVASGHPPLAALFDDALDAGVAVIVCQSGLQLADIAADTCHPRVTPGGMVGVLAEVGSGRLVVL